MTVNRKHPQQSLRSLVAALHAGQPELFANVKYKSVQEAEPFFISNQHFDGIDFSRFAIDYCCFVNCKFTNVQFGPRHFMQVGFVDCSFVYAAFENVRAGFDFIRCAFEGITYKGALMGPTDISLGSTMLECSGDKDFLRHARGQRVRFDSDPEKILQKYDTSQNTIFRTQ